MGRVQKLESPLPRGQWAFSDPLDQCAQHTVGQAPTAGALQQQHAVEGRVDMETGTMTPAGGVVNMERAPPRSSTASSTTPTSSPLRGRATGAERSGRALPRARRRRSAESDAGAADSRTPSAVPVPLSALPRERQHADASPVAPPCGACDQAHSIWDLMAEEVTDAWLVSASVSPF